MKKTEIIWREILYQGLEKNNLIFGQKKLAEQFGFSTSTIFAALKNLRLIGAVEVQKKFFRLRDFEKLLFYWATQRQLTKNIIYKTKVFLPIREIEGLLPGSVIPTCYTAYRFLFNEAPADYDRVYVYGGQDVTKRFPFQKGNPNLFVLKADNFLKNYERLPLAQLFVDLWNLPEWYAREFYQPLLKKLTVKL